MRKDGNAHCKRASIDDAQVLDAIDAIPCVDHAAQLLRGHGCGAEQVGRAVAGRFEPIGPFLVRRERRRAKRRVGNDGLHDGRFVHAAGSFSNGDGDRHVKVVGQVAK